MELLPWKIPRTTKGNAQPAADGISDARVPSAARARAGRALAQGPRLLPHGREETARQEAEVSLARRASLRQRQHPHRPRARTKCSKTSSSNTRTWRASKSPYVPGWDCHGLPIELGVEKQLLDQKRDKATVPITELRALCRDYANKYIGISERAVPAARGFRRLGSSLRDDEPGVRRFDRARARPRARRTAISIKATSPSTGARTTRPRSPKPRSSTPIRRVPRST